MIYQPPAGARDLLPLEVAQKCWINDNLLQIFYRWGYQRIVTSTLERLDSLIAGGAIESSSVIQLQDIEDGNLGLRPELTASIARAAVTRMESDSIQRLCYRANVFKKPPSGYHGRQLEFYQAGVELLFAGGLLADAEILLLLVDSLYNLGLSEWQLVLGDAGLTRSLLSCFPLSLQKRIRTCIAQMDRVSLEKLPLSDELLSKALLLFDLRGKPTDVIQKVASLDLDESARAIVNNLKALIELLNDTSPSPLPLVLDLSLLQTIDYYTGIVFKAVSYTNKQWHILAQGGRYDQLVGVYHPQEKTAPGIGFAFNVEDLHACLLESAKLPHETLASDWLVIPENSEAIAAAFSYAQKLRNSKHLVRVEIELSGADAEQIRAYARDRRINRLVWVQSNGSPRIEQN